MLNKAAARASDYLDGHSADLFIKGEAAMSVKSLEEVHPMKRPGIGRIYTKEGQYYIATNLDKLTTIRLRRPKTITVYDTSSFEKVPDITVLELLDEWNLDLNEFDELMKPYMDELKSRALPNFNKATQPRREWGHRAGKNH